MGLHVSHGCFNSSYSTFNEWRRELAKVACLPPLDLMEGFLGDDILIVVKDFVNCLDKIGYNISLDQFPILWINFEHNPLVLLLNHSDCDGRIPYELCEKLAESLEEVSHKIINNYYKNLTIAFITGLRLAAEKKEDIVFN